ncbi:hypothetical protein [Crocosphaera chwakensis]|uniref:Uncharacterized protein n=1 Tax=Crocosphaera chwakensis CCY0110 TaxID=391612 RepID=A3IZL1_9CHRO|nr:hypothetical protein [Crocosphaera chwakensis]EAZ88084.1 hypothetical protein CY0110_14715 [Crocosphaera chwakensis CCY0110]
MNLTTVNNNSQKSFFSQFKALDWFCFSAGIGSVVYYLYTVPLFVLLAICVFGSLYPFLGIPFVQSSQGATIRSVKLKLGNFRLTIKLWHLLALALAIMMVFFIATPSHAFFLTTAQTKIENTICAATSGTTGTGGTGGTGTCTASALVTVIFDVVRIVVVFAVIGGVVAIVVQGQQQQDVRPAVMFVGVVFGTVLTVEAMSRWLLG